MSTRRNLNIPGDAHELTFTCYRRHPFLKAERTCAWLKDAIDDARMKYAFDLWAYVFMPDHAHVIVRPREAVYDIAKIRGAIKEPVSRRAFEYLTEHEPAWLERLSVRRGKKLERHYWQTGGGYDRNISRGETLQAMLDYVHANPVRKGLCVRAQDWSWSSAAWFYGMRDIPLRVDPIPAEWLS